MYCYMYINILFIACNLKQRAFLNDSDKTHIPRNEKFSTAWLAISNRRMIYSDL